MGGIGEDLERPERVSIILGGNGGIEGGSGVALGCVDIATVEGYLCQRDEAPTLSAPVAQFGEELATSVGV